MVKGLLKDVRVTIPHEENVKGTLYKMKPVITVVFELQQTASDVKKGRVQMATGYWIVDTDSALKSVSQLLCTDLEARVENKLRKEGITYSKQSLKLLTKEKFQEWCILMTVESNRRQFLERFQGHRYELVMKQTSNRYEGNLIPEIHRISGELKDDLFDRVLSNSPSKFSLNRKRK